MIGDILDFLFTCFLFAVSAAGLALFGFWIWIANHEYEPHSLEDFDPRNRA